MDRFDAVIAAELIGAPQVVPIHYGTFPPIETDAQAFAADVGRAGAAQVTVLEPGEDAGAPMITAVVLIEADRDQYVEARRPCSPTSPASPRPTR